MRKIFFLSLLVAGSFIAYEASAQSAFSDPQEQAATTDGGLAPVETDIQAGSIPVGSTSQVIVKFKNDSGVPIEFKDIRLYPSSTIASSVSENECNRVPLPSGAQCAVILSIKGLQPGNWRNEILINHTGRSRLVTTSVSGLVEPNADNTNIMDIEANPTPVDFGSLNDSRPIVRSVTLKNITSNPITISDMYIDTPKQSGFTLRSDCKTLASGQACIASILWSPIVEGPSSGFLVLEHDGPSRISNISLTGEFKPDKKEAADLFPNSSPGKGVLVSSEVEVDFGSGINAQSAITVSLVNDGDGDLTLENIKLAGSENGLKLIENGCENNTVLAPTAACPLTISWSPTKIGSVIDDVQIHHSGARGILVLPIRGSATEAISVDSKPIIMSHGNADTSGHTSGVGRPVLDGYIVTSHSNKHAIIRGPVGSRIVADGKMVLLGGYEWMVSITDIGVHLSNGENAIILVFDQSLTARSPSGTTTNAPAN